MELLDIKILNTTVDREMNRAMKDVGLTSAQAYVLGCLNIMRQQDICQRDIEEALNLKHPTVSSILKLLEEKSIIRTEPLSSDHRYKKIMQTEKGRRIHEEMMKKYASVYHRAAQGFTKEELNQFSSYLVRMNENLLQ